MQLKKHRVAFLASCRLHGLCLPPRSNMITVQQWRVSIGTFIHGSIKVKKLLHGLSVNGEKVSLAVKIILFALLTVSNSVELNPGPATVASLSVKVDEMEKKLADLISKYENIQDENELLRTACVNLAEKVESLESHSRRSNIILHNIPTNELNEPWEKSEEKANEFFSSLGLEERPSIDRAHRLNPKRANSPIIVKLSNFKDKNKIIKKVREIKREKRNAAGGNPEHHQPDDVYAQEDFTSRVRLVRQNLRPSLQEAINAGKKAYFSYDKLIIDGKPSWYDDTKKAVTTVKPKTLSCLDIKTSLDSTE